MGEEEGGRAGPIFIHEENWAIPRTLPRSKLLPTIFFLFFERDFHPHHFNYPIYKHDEAEEKKEKLWSTNSLVTDD